MTSFENMNGESSEYSSPESEETTLRTGRIINLTENQVKFRLLSLMNFNRLAMSMNPQSPETRALYSLFHWVKSDEEDLLDEVSKEVLQMNFVLPLEPDSSATWYDTKALYDASLTISDRQPWAINLVDPFSETSE